MKILICVLTAALLCMSGSKAVAQAVPPELVGIYTGSVKFSNYESVPSLKANGSVLIQIFSDSTAQMTVSGASGGSSDPVNGEAASLGSNLFFRFPVSSGFSLGGRMAVKGKAGKQSLKGLITANDNGYSGLYDYEMKLKRLP